LGRNDVQLSARVIARETLRHTPAGVPILAVTLRHESRQIENSVPRQVELAIDAVAVGELAQQMNSVEVGTQVHVAGFLASRSKLSSRVVLHVNRFEIE
jgi:primosomal replication protein N